MSETITVTGNVGSDVTGNTTVKGDAVASFRLASTERWLDRQTGAWVDGATNWYSVVCFRNLARNAGCSLSKGQPVIVTGRLKVRPWERDGKSGTNVQIEAESIGHNLRMGTTRFSSGGDRPPAGVDAETGEIVDDDGSRTSVGAGPHEGDGSPDDDAHHQAARVGSLAEDQADADTDADTDAGRTEDSKVPF